MAMVGDLDIAVMKDLLAEVVTLRLEGRTKLMQLSKHSMRNAIMKLASPHCRKLKLARQLHACAHSEALH